MSEATILTANEILRCSSLLSSLSEEEISDISAYSKMHRYDRGDVIWHRGQHLDYFGAVGAGFVKMVQTTPIGQDLTNEIMGPGQVFGLLGLLDGNSCPLTAKAVCDTVILHIPKAEFIEAYQTNGILKDRILYAATRKIRDSQNYIKMFATGKVEQRIAAVLLSLCESYGQAQGSGIVISIPLTRQDISEMTGTTVETTIRTMSRLQKIGILATIKKILVINKPDELRAILGDN
jgi:CRP-like cAMP-binding protein